MKKTLIIAEAGVNHNGNDYLAEKMIYVAKEAGADCVKFQTAVPTSVISKFAPKAEYQIETTGNAESQLEMCQKLHLPLNKYKKLQEICEKIEIGFLSTPFDFESIDALSELRMAMWKIPSGEITNVPYLIRVARSEKPIILSTGMSTMDEVEFAFRLLRENGAEEISLLHCNTEYPTPYEDVNLRAMLTLKEKFCCKVGYSDHTQGIEVPIAAVAMGAEIIEKHFTLDKKMEGPDHKASLEPHELKAMVEAIRNVERALGNSEKKPSPSELKNKDIARKSIVAKRDIKKGEIFSEENITVKRPGNGVSPILWFEVLGQAAKMDFLEDELIEL